MTIAPWISVGDGEAALAFYAAAFGAVERERLEDGGRVVVARMAVGDAEFWFQEDPDTTVPDGGGPIRLILAVGDPDTVFAAALSAGATEVFPVGEGHGWRVGRLADPWRHHWEVGRRIG